MAKSRSAVLSDAHKVFAFTCERCANAFPARCDVHQGLREQPVAKSVNYQEAAQELTELKRAEVGGPMPDYEAPYERLETEIRETLSES